MKNAMSRREFFSALFTPGPETPSDPFAGMSLPPEFTPAMLAAEAGHLGLDTGKMTEAELRRAVLATMYAQAPAGMDGTGATETDSTGASPVPAEKAERSGDAQSAPGRGGETT